LVGLLEDPEARIFYGSVVALRRLVDSSESDETDRALVEQGVLRGVVNMIESFASKAQENHYSLIHPTLTLLALLRRPEIAEQTVSETFRILPSLLLVQNKRGVSRVLSLISSMVAASPEQIQRLSDAGVLQFAVNNLGIKTRKVLRLVENLAGSSAGIQALIDSGLLKSLTYYMLSRSYESRLRSALSFILDARRQALFDNGIVAEALRLFKTHKNNDFCWLLSNIARKGSLEQVKFLVQRGAIKSSYDACLYYNERGNTESASLSVPLTFISLSLYSESI